MDKIVLELIVALIFGFSVDFADLLDEHGLKWFKGADILFGILWGLTGALMMFIYPSISVFVVGLVLYWICVKKIDYLNHQIAATIILISGAWHAYIGEIDPYLLVIYVLSYLLVSFLNSILKKKFAKAKIMLLRHYIPTMLLWIFTGNFLFILVNLAISVGVYISDKWFKWFETNQNSKFFKNLGLYISTNV